jgi:hypothetical protein
MQTLCYTEERAGRGQPIFLTNKYGGGGGEWGICPGIKQVRGVTLTIHSHLVQKLKKSRGNTPRTPKSLHDV